ncbi:MAG: M50 family metallopeptidase [Patescibacteria group bacterium]
MTAILFILVISLLIFIHELGHFIMAKRAGMRVEEFGFGFPPRLWGVTRGETVYSINWIPFGGFVKVFGEDGEHAASPRSFSAGTAWQRFAVLVAGIVMNFLLAVVFLTVNNAVGVRTALDEADQAMIAAATHKAVYIARVAPESPAEAAGMRTLDVLVSARRGDVLQSIMTAADVQTFTNTYKGETVQFTLKRGEEMLVRDVALRADPPVGQGPLGISPLLIGKVSHPWYEAPLRGFLDAARLTWVTVQGYASLLAQLVTTGTVSADLSGPIGIASLTGQAARVGWDYLIQFIAMISINLAVLNAFPFPALDGGRILFLAIEKIRGAPLAHTTEGLVNGVGFLVLLLAMILITARDVMQLF